jgi:AcrR family transcriptional regulator
MVDTKVEILEATRRALVEHGFQDLSTQKIADELDRSHSLVHYHFETRADLLVAFVEHFAGQFEQVLDTIEHHDPGGRLARFLALMAGNADVPEIRSLNLAVYEMQASAHKHPELREPLADYHATLVDFLVDTMEDGVASGAFEAVDPRSTAELLLSAVDGAFLRQYTLEVDTVERVVFEGLRTQVLEDLYVEEVPDLRVLAAELDPEELSRRVAGEDETA